jgi:hypothetical protein
MVVLGRRSQFRNVLNDEGGSTASLNDVHVWLPERSAAVADPLLIQQREPLAGGAPDNDVCRWDRSRLLD